MDDRVHFASLIFAKDLGIITQSQVLDAARKRLGETKQPQPWLVELASHGHAAELVQLISSADERVYLEALRLAYRTWIQGKISDARFSAFCGALRKTAGKQSKWFNNLVWVDDEFGSLERQVAKRGESIKRIRLALQNILDRPQGSFLAPPDLIPGQTDETV